MIYILGQFINIPNLRMRAEVFDSLWHKQCVRHPNVARNVIYCMYPTIYIVSGLFSDSRGFMGCIRRYMSMGGEEVPQPDVSGRGAVDRLLTKWTRPS